MKPLTTREIRTLSTVRRFKVKRKIPKWLTLSIAILIAYMCGWLSGLYQAETVAKSICDF